MTSINKNIKFKVLFILSFLLIALILITPTITKNAYAEENTDKNTASLAYLFSPYDNEVSVYRLQNLISSEHLFTTSWEELTRLTALTWYTEENPHGRSMWNWDMTGWYAPKYESSTTKKVYRLYNADLGALGRNSHYYTTNEEEIKNLTQNWGWKNEGVAFLSGGDIPVYTAYSEALGSDHLYTTNVDEWKNLDGGWDKEVAKNGKTGFFQATRIGPRLIGFGESPTKRKVIDCTTGTIYE